MPIKNEGDVKKEVKKVLESFGKLCWWYMPVQTGYGVKGIPDFMINLNGRFVAIETKFGGNVLSAHQEIQRNAIVQARGDFYTVDENNVDMLEELLRDYIV
jgi:hypothetical protein